MGKSRKNRGGTKKKPSYYDGGSEAYSDNKKKNKARFNDNRKDKSFEQGIFIDWDSL